MESHLKPYISVYECVYERFLHPVMSCQSLGPCTASNNFVHQLIPVSVQTRGDRIWVDMLAGKKKLTAFLCVSFSKLVQFVLDVCMCKLCEYGGLCVLKDVGFIGMFVCVYKALITQDQYYLVLLSFVILIEVACDLNPV